jgi:PLD-like domain
VRSLNYLRAAALTLLLLAAASCGGGGEETTGPRTNLRPEDLVPEVQVQAVDFKFRNSGLSDDNLAVDPVLQLIASATTSLDIAATRIDRQEFVAALLAEAQSGTNIRIVTEKAYYDDAAYQPFYAQLEDPTKNNNNIEVHTDKEGLPRMMHSRFIIVDQARVVTGSYTWESSTNADTIGDVVTILNTGVAAAFASQFNQMFVEGLFGVNKRDDSAHIFGVGGVENGAPRATLEVYFGPTDRPTDFISTEFASSNNVIFAVQQFSDPVLAGTVFGYVGAGRNLVAMINDFGEIGEQDENDIYFGLVNATANLANNQSVAINGVWNDVNQNAQFDQNEFSHWLPKQTAGALDEFATFNTLNHKLIYADHAFGGRPTITTTTANFSNLGFTLNDEVFIFMRGLPLTNKYFRGINYISSIPPDVLESAGDVQELDQLVMMFPYIGAPESQLTYRPFSLVPTSLVFGDVPNFRQTVSIEDPTGQSVMDVDVDLRFSIFGTTYFGQQIGSNHKDANGDFDDTFPLDVNFIESEAVNADHEYMMVIPAGQFTIVVDTFQVSGDTALPFEQTTREISTGPGGGRRVTLRMGRPQTDIGGGRGGSGGV